MMTNEGLNDKFAELAVAQAENALQLNKT